MFSQLKKSYQNGEYSEWRFSLGKESFFIHGNSGSLCLHRLTETDVESLGGNDKVEEFLREHGLELDTIQYSEEGASHLEYGDPILEEDNES